MKSVLSSKAPKLNIRALSSINYEEVFRLESNPLDVALKHSNFFMLAKGLGPLDCFDASKISQGHVVVIDVSNGHLMELAGNTKVIVVSAELHITPL